MKPATMKCPVCGGNFEEGFILDFGYFKPQYVSRWVEGEPKMVGISRVPAFTDRRNYYIEASRCTGCGYLSLFANKEIGR